MNSYEAGYSFGLLIVILGIVIVPAIFYLLTLQNAIKRVRPSNRKIEPGMVWLCLIPLFNYIWAIIMVGKIADSLSAEFSSRGIKIQEQRPGYGIGLTYTILSLTGWIPFIGVLTGLGAFVCWIIYWVKINEYKNKLPLDGSILQNEEVLDDEDDVKLTDADFDL